jgi:hypothetical protein
MQYGIHAPVVTFRKMALLNGIFAGIAGAFIFIFAIRFSGSLVTALIAVLAHAAAGFVLMNSINSEDIMPGYTMFLGAALCYLEFLRLGRVWLIPASAVLFALATLFHWTLMAPGLAAIGALSLAILPRSRAILLVGVAWLGTFLGAVWLLLFAVFPSMQLSIWRILYPEKADYGWVGFHAEKFYFLAIGTGNYFLGAQNSGVYRGMFQGLPLVYMVVSWAFVALGLGSCIASIADKRAALPLKYFALFALVLFLTGEFGHLYSQPQDPQMHLEPMFGCIAGLVLLGRRVQSIRFPKPKIAAAAAAVLIIVSIGACNLRIFWATAGEDRQGIAGATELGRLFPKEKTLIVNHSFERWNSWYYILICRGDWAEFQKNTLATIGPFLAVRGVSAADAAATVQTRIDTALGAGQRVVASSLWPESSDAFVHVLSSVVEKDRAEKYDSILRPIYRIGTEWRTQSGRFVDLLPRTLSTGQTGQQ